MGTVLKGSAKEKALLTAHFAETRPLRVLIVTLSDRASEGVYEDKSGPRVRDHLEGHLDSSGVSHAIASKIISDDAGGLLDTLEVAVSAEVDVIITTGGTGVGPRDNTPDVMLPFADKIIPGIMELIRMKYGADKPCALLSRTVAATKGRTLLYALPGSSKGVDEYMTEIVKTLDHLLCVLHELEVH